MGYIWSTKENFLGKAKQKKVICFGAGRLLQTFIEENMLDDIHVCEIWDNDNTKQGVYNACIGKKIPVSGARKLTMEERTGYIFLITCGKEREVREQLMKMEVREEQIFKYPFICRYPTEKKERKDLRINNPTFIMLDKYCKEFGLGMEQCMRLKNMIEIKTKMEQGMVLPYLTALVTSYCTLNCRDCNNLMPYCEEKRFLKSASVIKDVKRVCSVIDACVCLNITGGEPFLHRELAEIVDGIAKIKNILFVEIITNGTIIPQGESLNVLKNPKVIVKISVYKGFTKIRELRELFEKENVRYQLQDNLEWVSSGGTQRRNKERDRISQEYLECWAGKYCKSIWDGKLFGCARAAFLHEVRAIPKARNYIEIEKENFKEELEEFYLMDYLDACDFCDHVNIAGKRVEPAIQI